MPRPKSKNGLDAFACLSAQQKCIRRGMEREAMQFAVELMHTGKSVHAAVCNRLEIITHEDIDTGSQPWIVPFVRVRMRTDAAMVRGRQTRRGAARHRQRDPHDGQGGQVTGGLPFRGSDRARVRAGGRGAERPGLGTRPTHDRRPATRQGHRAFPPRGRAACAAAGRQGRIRR
jgi:hypothetical protein